MDRLKSDGNPLGWRPETRIEGVAILRADLPYPAMPGCIRVCRVALTEAGLLYMDDKITEEATGRVVEPVRPVKRRPPTPPEPLVLEQAGGANHIDLRGPSDGALLVRDRGWYRCPTPKCKVVV